VLTTKTSSDIAANLVSATDVNSNVLDSRNPAKPRMLSPEASILFDKAIIARSLATPEVCNIHVKNTDYYYRWVFAEGRGQTYKQRKAMGFTNATTDDVEVLVGDAVATEGEVRSGDLILMKIQYARWAAHIKANMQRAQVLGNARGLFHKNDPSTDVFSDEAPQRASVAQEGFNRNLAKTYIPDDPDRLVDGANAADARKTISDIRSKIQEGGK